jgi:Resolvase, N terminal domain
MKRAVLYARVSTDAQQKEGTIESQVLELKRQIAAAGDVLVKEYIDDGYSGTLLDRPALEELRRDVRTNLFDAVYFLDTDRIARDVAYQTIILGELVAALRSPLHEDFVDASVRQFCASARARFQACADFDAKRQFLLGHIERVIYNRYQVTLAGSVPAQSASGETKLQFRIDGEIDRKAMRPRSRTVRPEDGRWMEHRSVTQLHSAAFRPL